MTTPDKDSQFRTYYENPILATVLQKLYPQFGPFKDTGRTDLSAVLGTGLYTYTSMFRAYRRPSLEVVPVHDSGFIAVTHLLVFPVLAGYRVVEHPTVLSGRRFGTSKLRVVRVIRQHLVLLTRIVLWRTGLRRRI